jgi:hypothetical protein
VELFNYSHHNYNIRNEPFDQLRVVGSGKKAPPSLSVYGAVEIAAKPINQCFLFDDCRLRVKNDHGGMRILHSSADAIFVLPFIPAFAIIIQPSVV